MSSTTAISGASAAGDADKASIIAAAAATGNSSSSEDDGEIDVSLASGLVDEPDGAFVEFRRRVMAEHARRFPTEVIDNDHFDYICAKK